MTTHLSYRRPHALRAMSALVLLLMLVGCGTSNPVATSSEHAAVPAVASEWGLRGDGDETTEPMELAAGPATVRCIVTEATEFGLAIVDASGTTVEDLRSPAGDNCAGMSYDLAQSGLYTLRISADGPWEITVTSARTDGVTETRE